MAATPRTFDYDFPAYSHPRPASPPSSHIRPSYLHPQTTKQQYHNQTTRARGPSSASTSSEASTSTSSADPSSSSSTSSPRPSTPPRRRHPLPRPAWERDFAQSQDDTNDLDDVDVDADSDYSPEQPRHKPSFSPHLYGATTPYPYYDSPPRSYEDDASSSPLRSRLAHDSKHSHQEVDAHRAIALGLSLGLRRKRWEWDEKAYAGEQEKRGVLEEEEEPAHEPEGEVVDDEDMLDDDEGDDEEQYIRSPGHADFTPTCSEALKRKWQAVSLSWRFGVFRAKRRIRTRVGL